jgi:hypothetical protein
MVSESCQTLREQWQGVKDIKSISKRRENSSEAQGNPQVVPMGKYLLQSGGQLRQIKRNEVD